MAIVTRGLRGIYSLLRLFLEIRVHTRQVSDVGSGEVKWGMTSVAFCFPLSQAEARTGESNAFDGEQEERAEEGIKVVGIECFVIRNALHYEKCGIFQNTNGYQWTPFIPNYLKMPRKPPLR